MQPESPALRSGGGRDGLFTVEHLDQRRNHLNKVSASFGTRLPTPLELIHNGARSSFRKVRWYSGGHANRLFRNSKPVTERQYAYTPIADEHGVVRLFIARNELPLQPTPAVCLQLHVCADHPTLGDVNQLSPQSGRVAYLVFDWRPQSGDQMPSPSDEIPVPILDLVRPDSPWTYPTDTQLTKLIVRIAKDLDSLSRATYFWLSLESIFILNPSMSGLDRPLDYRLCPFSLLRNNHTERPVDITREELMMRGMARFCLQMATRLENLDVPHLQTCATVATARHPGIMAICTELSQRRSPVTATDERCESLDIPYVPQERSIRELSSSLEVMYTIRWNALVQAYTVNDVPALLQLLLCVDSVHWHIPAAAGLWRLVTGVKEDRERMIGILSDCIAILVPRGGASLIDPSCTATSAPWIWRMHIIERVLIEIERAGDYTRLRRTQQRLLENGIGNHLGSSLRRYQSKFSYGVLLPVVAVSTLVSFHFSPLKVRLLFDRNVRNLSTMAIEACAPGIQKWFRSMMEIEVCDNGMHKLIGMMMTMSDFWSWNSAPESDQQNQLSNHMMLKIWADLDAVIFLEYVLPCWSSSISDKTTAELSRKLEQCYSATFNALVNPTQVHLNSNSNYVEIMKKRLSYILGWMVNLAWNGPEQVASKSFQSLYSSYYVGLFFRCQRSFTVAMVNASRAGLILSDDEDDFAAREGKAKWDTPLDFVGDDTRENLPSPELCSLELSSPELGKGFLSHPTNETEYPNNAPMKTDTVVPSMESCPESALLERYYNPCPSNRGAPSSPTSLVTPDDRNDITSSTPPISSSPYEATYSLISSLSLREVHGQEAGKFVPVTLVTNQTLCHTNSPTISGTTGMFEVKVVDSGDTNTLTIGLTWDLENEKLCPHGGLAGLRPGHSSTSIGLVIGTGFVYYRRANGVKIKLPYVLPTGTGARICIGIAHRFVYFVVDGVFYPPLPDPSLTEGGYFMIPENANVHALVRFGCGGIKLTTRSMNETWSLDKTNDGVPIHSKSNPLAYMLYLASLRAKACPHYHAQRRSISSRPKLPKLPENDKSYSKLDSEHLELIQRIHLAYEPCGEDGCKCQAYIQEGILKLEPTPLTPSYSMSTTPPQADPVPHDPDEKPIRIPWEDCT